MNKTFTTIASNVGTNVQDTSTAFKTIIKNFVNNRYFHILRSINWNCVRPDYTFDTVAGTQEYVLPEDFGKEISVRDTTTGVELVKTDIQRLITDYPDDFDASGSAARYYIREDTVSDQPSSASVITVVSSSASDTTQGVTIRGISGGVEVIETVTLTGTTPADSTNSYTRVKSISKDAVTVGKVTATSNVSAVTIATISPQTLTSYVKLIGLHYVPTTALTISVPYIIKPQPLYDDDDYPVIDIADLIEMGAIADAWAYKRQMSKSNMYEVKFATALNTYIWDKENDPNEVKQFMPSTYNMDNLY